MSAVVVLDASVLMPNALGDLLLRLAEEDLYLPRWSAEILDEVRRNLPGVSPAAIERRIAFMNTAFDTAVISGYEHLVPEMTNQVKDRHVLAAAVACDADRIITCNLRDFPSDSCEPHGVEPEHPDDFLLGLWDREPVDTDHALLPSTCSPTWPVPVPTSSQRLSGRIFPRRKAG